MCRQELVVGRIDKGAWSNCSSPIVICKRVLWGEHFHKSVYFPTVHGAHIRVVCLIFPLLTSALPAAEAADTCAYIQLIDGETSDGRVTDERLRQPECSERKVAARLH